MGGKAKTSGKGTKEDGSRAGRKDGETEAVREDGKRRSSTDSGKGGKAASGSGSKGSSGSGSGSKGSGSKGRVGQSGAVAEKPSSADPLADSPPVPKKRTGRKSNAQKAQEDLDVKAKLRAQWQEDAKVLAPIIEGVVGIPFDIIAKKRGPHWKLPDDDKKKVSLAFAVVIEKHMPSFVEEYQEELALALILAGVVGVRVNTDRKIASEKTARKVPAKDVSASDHGHAPHGQDDIAAALAPSTA